MLRRLRQVDVGLGCGHGGQGGEHVERQAAVGQHGGERRELLHPRRRLDQGPGPGAPTWQWATSQSRMDREPSPRQASVRSNSAISRSMAPSCSEMTSRCRPMLSASWAERASPPKFLESGRVRRVDVGPPERAGAAGAISRNGPRKIPNATRIRVGARCVGWGGAVAEEGDAEDHHDDQEADVGAPTDDQPGPAVVAAEGDADPDRDGVEDGDDEGDPAEPARRQLAADHGPAQRDEEDRGHDRGDREEDRVEVAQHAHERQVAEAPRLGVHEREHDRRQRRHRRRDGHTDASPEDDRRQRLDVALGPAQHAMEVADEPEQDAGGEEVEDHARLERGVVVVDPLQRFGRTRIDARLLGIDEPGEHGQHHEGKAAQRADMLEPLVVHGSPCSSPRTRSI